MGNAFTTVQLVETFTHGGRIEFIGELSPRDVIGELADDLQCGLFRAHRLLLQKYSLIPAISSNEGHSFDPEDFWLIVKQGVSESKMTDDEIDEAVLAVAQPYWRKVAMIVLEAAKRLGSNLPAGDEGYVLIAKRISRLVADGRLVAQGEVDRWRNAEVRLP